MSVFYAQIFPLLIYWMVLFVACYAVIEIAQDQLYDEVTPGVGWKVTLGSLVLALMATWLRPSFETIFTANLAWTALQGVVWFLVFLFIFQFHPQHAIALCLPVMVMVTGLATMGVDSMTKPTPRTAATTNSRNNLPKRGSLGGAQAPEPSKTAEPAKK